MYRIFDWNKAAEIIKSKKAKYAEAGLMDDWYWTSSPIYIDGETGCSACACLGSRWATPAIYVDNEYIPCWTKKEDHPEWDGQARWPASALAILEGAKDE